MRFLMFLALILPSLAQAEAPQAADDYQTAGAAAGPVEQVNVTGIGRLTYQRLFKATSSPGETLDAFVVRISQRLRAFSDETDFEACGVLATDGERFGVVVGSNHSHIACANFNDFVPNGMKPLVETLHSHGTDKPHKPNANDLALAGPMLEKHGLGRNTRRPLNILSGQGVAQFSKRDYQGGPGYLAVPGGALYQAGEKNRRQITD